MKTIAGSGLSSVFLVLNYIESCSLLALSATATFSMKILQKEFLDFPDVEIGDPPVGDIRPGMNVCDEGPSRRCELGYFLRRRLEESYSGNQLLRSCHGNSIVLIRGKHKVVE